MDTRIKLKIGRDTPGNRVRAWERMIEENFFSVECLNAGSDLQTSIDFRCLDSGVVTHMRYSPQTLIRRPSMIKNMDEERVVIAAYRQGAQHLLQGREELEVNRDCVLITDVSRPFKVTHTSNVESCALQVPKASLVRRLGPIDTFVLGSNVPLQKLVAMFLRSLPDCIKEVDAETASRLIEQALDLTALMIGNLNGSKIEPSTYRAGMLVRLKAYIRAQVKNENLTVSQAAHALRISPRYIHALLATEGTSFGRYLLTERLMNARRDILDPRRVHRQVAEVAFDWGFKSASHFSRAFKEQYGLSPRDAKAEKFT